MISRRKYLRKSSHLSIWCILWLWFEQITQILIELYPFIDYKHFPLRTTWSVDLGLWYFYMSLSHKNVVGGRAFSCQTVIFINYRSETSFDFGRHISNWRKSWFHWPNPNWKRIWSWSWVIRGCISCRCCNISGCDWNLLKIVQSVSTSPKSKLLILYYFITYVSRMLNSFGAPASVAQLDAPSDWRPGGRGFNPRRGRQHSFVEIDHEIFSTVILFLPLIQEGQLSVSGERMCTILVNRLED